MTGWTALFAVGVNDSGDVSGIAEDAAQVRRTYVLKNAFVSDASRKFLLLPTLPSVGAVNYEGMDINNMGEVTAGTESGVVRYLPTLSGSWPYYGDVDTVLEPVPWGGVLARMNDFGEMLSLDLRGTDGAAQSFVQLVSGDDPIVLNGYSLRGVGNGWLCGTRSQIKGKNGRSGGAVRIPINGDGTLGDDHPLYEGSDSNYTRAINDEGDTCIEAGGRGLLYYDAGFRFGRPVRSLKPGRPGGLARRDGRRLAEHAGSRSVCMRSTIGFRSARLPEWGRSAER